MFQIGDALAVEYVTVEDARRYLGASKVTMARLIKERILRAEPNPLDRRVKLIRRRDVEKLKRLYPTTADRTEKRGS